LRQRFVNYVAKRDQVFSLCKSTSLAREFELKMHETQMFRMSAVGRIVAGAKLNKAITAK